MEKQILNNKIGIQIMVIITGIMLLILGIACACLDTYILTPYNGSIIRSYLTAFKYIGGSIALVGIFAIITGSIKIGSYAHLRKSIYSKDSNIIASNSEYSTDKSSFELMRNKISSLQQMKTDGLLNEAEYEEMKTTIIKNAGGLL